MTRRVYNKWTNEQRAALMRCADLYDCQWQIIRMAEPTFAAWNAEALRWQHRCLRRDGWQVPEGTNEIELEYDKHPEEIRRMAQEADPQLAVEVIDVGEHRYTVKDGKILFAIESRLIEISVEQWGKICAQYSALGGNLTRAQVARRNGVPLRLLGSMLALYGQYKASPPMTRERIAESGGELGPLVAEAVENLELLLVDKIEAARDDQWRREYTALKIELANDDRLAEQAARIAEHLVIGPAKKPARRASDNTWTALVPTTDEHLGLYVYGKASFGEDFTTDVAHNRLVNHGAEVAGWIEEQPGHCEMIVRPYLGDLFHALSGMTEHGTILHQDTRAERVWDLGLDAVIRNTHSLREAADKVVLHFVPGNHDGHEMYRFAKTIEIAFKNVPDVEVAMTKQRYSCQLIGETLHVFDHGYRVGALTGWKAKAQAEVVAREIGGKLYTKAKQVVVYIGHQHTFEMAAHGSHLELWRLSALCEVDDYTTDLRFAGDPAAFALRLSPTGAMDSFRRWTRAELDGPELR